MADFDPTDHTAHSTSPAAPLSADELAEMRRSLSNVEFLHPNGWYRNGDRVRSASNGQIILEAHTCGVNDVQFAADAPGMVRRLLAALEALTAENARLRKAGIAATEAGMRQMERVEDLLSERDRLRDTLNQTVQEACAAIDDELKPEIARLKARMADARALVDRGAVRAWNDTHCRTEPLSAERLRDIKTSDMFRRAMALLAPDAADTEAAMQELADLGQAMQPECYVSTDHGWYASHRRRVEAAHAAAKEAALPRALSELRAVWPAPSAEMQAIADDMRGEDGL